MNQLFPPIEPAADKLSGWALRVRDMLGNDRNSIYDKAGNILEKFVNGVRTKYTYDQANQLVSSETEGKVTRYVYDAAGRLIQEGDREYQYGWLDKVTRITQGGKTLRNFRYHVDGQLAAAEDGTNTETFLWDGLALIRRDRTNYLNEPAVTGGNPVIAGEKALFTDLLGSTLDVKDGETFSAVSRTAFGEVKSPADLGIDFFTGKPQIDGLGYSFLFRNYRADHGKWQTADPMGYPDGWNNLAYCNNDGIGSVDILGCSEYSDNALKIWKMLCSTRPTNAEGDNALANLRKGYYGAITAKNPFADISDLAKAVNAQADTIQEILHWTIPDNLSQIPHEWQDALGTIGYQINSGLNNAKSVLSGIQNVLNGISSAFDASGNIIAGREYGVIGSLLEYGASVAPYGTGSFLDFYANAYNSVIDAVINIGLFSNNTFSLIETLCAGIEHGEDYQTEYESLMEKLRNAGFAE